MKYIFLILIVFNSFYVKGQAKVDVEDMFKMEIFLFKNFQVPKSIQIYNEKNKKLYDIFSSSVKLNIDTLKIIKDFRISEIDNFKFYKLLPENVIYDERISTLELKYFSIDCNKFNSFIIAINHNNGKIYKLKGFGVNDFMSFEKDFRKHYLSLYNKKISLKYFLRNFKVEELDFYCLNKGLKDRNAFRNYECLMSCDEPISFH